MPNILAVPTELYNEILDQVEIVGHRQDEETNYEETPKHNYITWDNQPKRGNQEEATDSLKSGWNQPVKPNQQVTNRSETPLISNKLINQERSRMSSWNRLVKPNQQVTNQSETPLTLNKLIDQERSRMTGRSQEEYSETRSQNKHDLLGNDRSTLTHTPTWDSHPGHPKNAATVSTDWFKKPDDPDQQTALVEKAQRTTPRFSVSIKKIRKMPKIGFRNWIQHS